MKTRKILIYGEGPDDYGWKDSGGEWHSGSIITLLQRCAEEMEVYLEIGYVEKRFVDGKDKVKLGRRSLGNVDGKGIPARRFSIYAMPHGYTKGIFYCDADKPSDRSRNPKNESNCRKHFDKVYSDVVQGLQPAGNEHWKGIPMISLKMIECWLLSDQKAYKKCFGLEPRRVKLPSKPELIWGEKNNPSSDYPKNYMKRVLGQYQRNQTENDMQLLRRKHPLIP